MIACILVICRVIAASPQACVIREHGGHHGDLLEDLLVSVVAREWGRPTEILGRGIREIMQHYS